jgi:hypothetical protein
MGVSTVLAAITLPPATINQAQTLGEDLAGNINEIQNALASISAAMNKMLSEVLTPAGDATNIAIIQAQITALS